jgi:tRNA pseudouridine55 synthase
MTVTATTARRQRLRVDGVLLLDKPVGRSSNAALQHAKHLFAAEKAGHTGTLDPLASGLLPLCFGEATKFAQALLDARKTYVATMEFGRATDTGDAEGETVAQGPVPVDAEAVARTLRSFHGRIQQMPPRHSALKYRGRSYYEYARAGEEIPRTARAAEIHALELVELSLPMATLRVVCGKGTYIRVLAEDIAASLGTCAHLRALRRTAAGPFDIEHAVSLDALGMMDAEDRIALLLPPDAALSNLPALDLDARTAAALFQGRVAPIREGAPGRYRGLDPEGHFLGLVEVSAQGLRAVRLVRAQPELRAISSSLASG